MPDSTTPTALAPAIEADAFNVGIRSSVQPSSGKLFFNYASVAPMSRAAYEATRTFIDDFYRYGPPEVLHCYDVVADDMAAEAARRRQHG